MTNKPKEWGGPVTEAPSIIVISFVCQDLASRIRLPLQRFLAAIVKQYNKAVVAPGSINAFHR